MGTLAVTEHAGVVLSLAAAAMWAVSPLFMASVGRRIGSWRTNLLRAGIAAIVFAGVVLPVYWLVRGDAVHWPTRRQLAWLVVSGMAGMVVADTFFYEALVRLGPRRAVKMNTLAPVVALGLGWVWQGETLTGPGLAGAGLVIGAVLYATFVGTGAPGGVGREPGQVTAAGVACGVASAVGVAVGTILLRQAYKSDADRPLDMVLATTLRVGAAAIALWAFALARGDARRTVLAMADPLVRTRMVPGVILGPLGGMMCYVAAIKFAPGGLVITLATTSPLIVIPLVAIRYRTRVRWDVIAAALAAVVGVGMISWK